MLVANAATEQGRSDFARKRAHIPPALFCNGILRVWAASECYGAQRVGDIAQAEQKRDQTSGKSCP